MANNAVKKVTLKSSDGEEFNVPKPMLMRFHKIHHLIVDDGAQNAIPLADIHSSTLAKVIEYCSKHVTVVEKAAEEGSSVGRANAPDEEVQKWDAEFMEVDNDTLYYLMIAAQSLGEEDLLKLICRKLANMIKGKKVEEIRRMFNIQYDFSPEEEEEINFP